MTEEPQEPEQPADSKSNDEDDAGPQPYSLSDNVSRLRGDLFLEHLVDLCNRAGSLGMPVILTVQGQSIFGSLISMEEFFDASGATIESIPVVDDEGQAVNDGQAVTELLGKMLRDFPERSGWSTRDSEDEADDDDFNPPRYIHLKNANVMAVGGSDLGFWRGRLSEVSGWAIPSPDAS